MAGTTQAEYETQLASVTAAIAKAEKAASYSLSSGSGSRTMSHQAIDKLYDRQRELNKIISSMNRGGVSIRGVTTL